MTIYLQHLIVEHQKLFKSFYRDRNVIAKHHYPSSIRKADPLLHMCLRGLKANTTCLRLFSNLLKQMWSKAWKHRFAVACHCEPLTSNKMSLLPEWNDELNLRDILLCTKQKESLPFFSLFSPRFLFLFSLSPFWSEPRLLCHNIHKTTIWIIQLSK